MPATATSSSSTRRSRSRATARSHGRAESSTTRRRRPRHSRGARRRSRASTSGAILSEIAGRHDRCFVPVRAIWRSRGTGLSMDALPAFASSSQLRALGGEGRGLGGVLVRDQWQCRNCGVVLDIPSSAPLQVVVVGKSGEPNYRVTVMRGEEVHRCQIGLDDQVASVEGPPSLRYRSASVSHPGAPARRKTER